MKDFFEFRASIAEASIKDTQSYYGSRRYWSNVEYDMYDYPEFSDLIFPKFSPTELSKISLASAKKMGEKQLQELVKSLKSDVEVVGSLEYDVRGSIEMLDRESGDPEWKSNRKALVSFHKEIKQQVKMSKDKLKLLQGIPTKKSKGSKR